MLEYACYLPLVWNMKWTLVSKGQAYCRGGKFPCCTKKDVIYFILNTEDVLNHHILFYFTSKIWKLYQSFDSLPNTFKFPEFEKITQYFQF